MLHLDRYQLLDISNDITDILSAYMPAESARERANNIAVLFSVGRQSTDAVEKFLVPSEINEGIADSKIRNAVARLILALQEDYT